MQVTYSVDSTSQSAERQEEPEPSPTAPGVLLAPEVAQVPLVSRSATGKGDMHASDSWCSRLQCDGHWMAACFAGEPAGT